MRRILNVALCLALVLTLAAPVLADNDGLKVHNATGKKNETVYLTVELTEEVKGSALAVEYTYNTNHLKALPKSCSWARASLIQDFDLKGGVGVWGAAAEEDLKGGVCVLAFQVKALAFFQQTEVTCTVTVRGEDQESKTFTATGKVIMDCDHSFGEWTDGGNLGHYQSCSKCGGKRTENHKWDSGMPMQDQNDPDKTVTVFTCSVCGGIQENNSVSQLITPPTEETTESKPESFETNPPVPEETKDNHLHNEHQGNTGSQQNNGQEHTHTDDQQAENATVATLPQSVIDALMGKHEGHDHETETEPKDYTATVIALVVVVAVLVGGMVFFLKRKK